MGLAEKRLAQEIKANKLPEFEKKLQDMAGYPINVTLDWDTFTAYDSYPLSRLDIVFSDVSSFMKKICSDELGKEALQEKMKTIHLINTDSRDKVSMEFKDDTLVMTMQLVGDSFNAYRDYQITEYVEAQL